MASEVELLKEKLKKQEEILKEEDALTRKARSELDSVVSKKSSCKEKQQ
jgi:hypothetical protein